MRQKVETGPGCKVYFFKADTLSGGGGHKAEYQTGY